MIEVKILEAFQKKKMVQISQNIDGVRQNTSQGL